LALITKTFPAVVAWAAMAYDAASGLENFTAVTSTVTVGVGLAAVERVGLAVFTVFAKHAAVLWNGVFTLPSALVIALDAIQPR
jgi:hypothetical protein